MLDTGRSAAARRNPRNTGVSRPPRRHAASSTAPAAARPTEGSHAGSGLSHGAGEIGDSRWRASNPNAPNAPRRVEPRADASAIAPAAPSAAAAHANITPRRARSQARTADVAGCAAASGTSSKTASTPSLGTRPAPPAAASPDAWRQNR